MFSGVLHDGDVVPHQSFERRIDLRRRVKIPKAVLRKRPMAFPAGRSAQEQVDVVLAACDLVEKVDVVDVRPAVDAVVLVPWSYLPTHRTPP
jgi:hypothetical protein